MGFDIDLFNEDGSLAKVPKHTEGSTIVVGGTEEASMTLTYNYSKFYYAQLDEKQGIKWLDGKKAKDTLDKLSKAIHNLGVEFSGDYWEATPGNAGKALVTLLSWAYLNPNAEWVIN